MEESIHQQKVIDKKMANYLNYYSRNETKLERTRLLEILSNLTLLRFCYLVKIV